MSDEFIPLSVPNLKGNELKYVTNAVETEWVSTAGPYVKEFEEKFAEYVGVPQAVSCQSGTSGLHVAFRLAGVRRGDLVIAPPVTFIAAVNPIRYLGADPVFIDCDDSLCMDPEKLREFCEEECERAPRGGLIHRATGRPIRAMVVVHVFGNMADMEAILDIAGEYGLKVVEDATEALGTKYTEGRHAGHMAGTMADLGVYSFNGNKIMTTGGGGMIVAKDPQVAEHAKHLTTQAKADTLYFVHDEVGYNYRLTNLQAALGLAQLEQIDTFIETKSRNWELYRELIEPVEGLELLGFRLGTRPNRWFYSVVCDPERFDRDQIIRNLSSKHHIQTRPIWGLINEQKPYVGSLAYKMEKAMWYHDRVVNVPCSTNLTSGQVHKVVEALLAEGK